MTIRLDEIPPVGKRIMEIIHHYRLNKNSFSKMLALSDNSLINRIVNDPYRGTSLEMLQKIVLAFPDINTKWLILNEGEMLTKEKFPDPQYHYIKYFKEQENEPIDFMRIYGYDDCNFAFDVVGDMMSPKYQTGDIILCKECDSSHIIRCGEAYRIVLKSIPSIRYIKSEINENSFKVGAESPHYEDSIIKKDEIEKMFLIKGSIRRSTL